MPRLHLFEFGDQRWFPLSIRRQGMELLRDLFRITRAYSSTAPILCRLLIETKKQDVVVLAAGSGGGVLDIAPLLPRDSRMILTDIFPDSEFKTHDTRIRYEQTPVDATNVSGDLSGLRVFYTAFHHFKPAFAKRILEDAVRAREPIAIFEVTERSIAGLAAVIAFPFIAIFATPFVRPFRWSRLLWTYLVPVMPILGMWDGLVSVLRTYDQQELKSLVRDLDSYEWNFERLKGPAFLRVIAFTGRPR